MKALVTQPSVKLFLLTMALTVLVSQAFAQNNPITSITISLPANPDANTVNWGAGTSQLTISATARAVNGRVDGLAQESRILVIIKKGGAKVCGDYTTSTAPEAGFTTISKVWAGSNASSLLGKGCVLPAGDYELTVQFFNARGATILPASELKTKSFTIKGNEQQTYQAAQPVSPVNNLIFKETDIAKPISFRWTPIVPRPQEPTTYRLKVWQLMQGQTGAQARTVNQPIFTKDVDNITQAIISNLITGPCKPPYLCSFIWNVQALNREGKPIGENNGTSELFSFKVEDAPAVTTGTVKLGSPANGTVIAAGEVPEFKWFPLTTATGQETYRIKVVVINGDQSPDVALRTNKPIFEKDSPSFLQVLPLVKFATGKTYVWNVQALNRDGKPIGSNNGTSETFSFNVKEASVTTTGTVKLNSPANGVTIAAGEAPQFSWARLTTATGQETYKIKVVVINGDQSPDVALRTNKPIFEKDSMKELSLRIPLVKFNAGKKYVWNVQALNRERKPVGNAEVFVFTIGPAVPPKK